MWVSKEFYFFVRWGCFNFFWVGLCVAKVWFSVKEQRKCQPNKSRPKDLFEFVCLVVFESVFCCRVGSLRLLPTATCMKRWGLRASSLSAVAKADAGQKHSRNHLTPNVLYMML